MTKFEQISAFIDVVNENGFAAAGRKQRLSTAAISRKISKLEAELGVQLLNRTQRQIFLTEIGKQYYQKCKQVMNDLAEAETIISASQTEATGTLKITSNRYLATKFLFPRLDEFMAQNPKLHIHFDLAERFPDFANEDVDLLFGVTVEGPPDLIQKKIATTRYILCATPHYLKTHGTPETPNDLIKHRYITHSIRKPDNVITFKDNREIFIEPSLWLNDNNAIRECALLGMGIVKLHDYMITNELNNGELIEILPDQREPLRPLYLYYQQNRYLHPKIRRFIDFYVP